jgi:pimeloyl-ACP methyl ester carboxylesterase
MRGLAIERAHVVGLSMGGCAALQFVLSYPEKASAIVKSRAFWALSSAEAGVADIQRSRSPILFMERFDIDSYYCRFSLA